MKSKNELLTNIFVIIFVLIISISIFFIVQQTTFLRGEPSTSTSICQSFNNKCNALSYRLSNCNIISTTTNSYDPTGRVCRCDSKIDSTCNEEKGLTSCNTASDCPSTQFCRTVSPAYCQDKFSDGSTCSYNLQCKSNLCNSKHICGKEAITEKCEWESLKCSTDKKSILECTGDFDNPTWSKLRTCSQGKECTEGVSYSSCTPIVDEEDNTVEVCLDDTVKECDDGTSVTTDECINGISEPTELDCIPDGGAGDVSEDDIITNTPCTSNKELSCPDKSTIISWECVNGLYERTANKCSLAQGAECSSSNDCSSGKVCNDAGKCTTSEDGKLGLSTISLIWTGVIAISLLLLWFLILYPLIFKRKR